MKSTIVFHISEGMIKFLQVSGAQKRTVTAIDVIMTDDLSETQIVQKLASLVKQKRIKLQDAHVTLLIPRTRSILRHMTLPSQKEDEIRAMVDLQVVNHIPYSREEVEIDVQILSKTADGYSKVVAVIIPHEVAMKYWRMFSDAHIPVNCMTISSVGLWMLYRQQASVNNEMGAVVDLDINHSEICLCHKDYWLTSREIPLGLVQLERDGYSEFIRQWELTQINTGTEKLAQPINSVYVVTTSGQLKGLGEEISKEQGAVVKEISLMQQLPTARNLVWPKLWLNEGASLAALAGIAFSNEPPTIDLVPNVVRQQQHERNRRKDLIVFGFWAICALIASSLALSSGLIKKSTQLKNLEQQLKTTKKESVAVETQLTQLHQIEDVIKNRFVFMDLVQEIYKLLPRSLSLISLSISDQNTLSLQGVSSRASDINQFQRDMVDSAFFSNVNLDYVNKRVTQEGEVNYFKITTVIKSAKGSDEKTE